MRGRGIVVPRHRPTVPARPTPAVRAVDYAVTRTAAGSAGHRATDGTRPGRRFAVTAAKPAVRLRNRCSAAGAVVPCVMRTRTPNTERSPERRGRPGFGTEGACHVPPLVVVLQGQAGSQE